MFAAFKRSFRLPFYQAWSLLPRLALLSGQNPPSLPVAKVQPMGLPLFYTLDSNLQNRGVLLDELSFFGTFFNQ